MKIYLALPLLALAAPAAAQADADYRGVWAGTVGTYPVVMCLTGNGGEDDTRGAYYYRSQLKPIGLQQAGDGWDEHEHYQPSGAEWRGVSLSGETLSGTWKQGKRSLRFSLARQQWDPGELDDPCMSAAFLGPRSGGGKVTESSVRSDGWRYTHMIYEKPRHLDEGYVSSFRLDPVQPGDAAINAVLAKDFPDGTAASDLMQCMGQAIGAHGSDGYYGHTAEPFLVTRQLLVTFETYDSDCGGAHPSSGFFRRTFDRQSGAEFDALSWLVDTMTEYVPGEGPDELGYYKVLPPLRALILARGPDSDAGEPYEPECAEYAVDEEFWNAGIAREGMQFSPSVPHVLGPCAATFTVPWSTLGPFLSKDGDDGRRALREDPEP